MPLWLPHLLQAGSLIVLCVFAALLALLSSGILRRALARMPILYAAPQETYRRYRAASDYATHDARFPPQP
ncbi:MAG: hypothetical protein ABI068_04250 [Ktedonobacterales bacterium]